MSSEIDEVKTEIFETLDKAEKALLEFDQMPDGAASRALYDEVLSRLSQH